MVGLPYDCLANPLGAVRLTFEKAIASGSDPASFNGKDWGAVDLFRQFLFDHGGLSEVPLLNSVTVRCIQPNTLVRFRGMIQDMLGNEFYVGAYKDGSTWRTNKFMDVAQFPMGSSPNDGIWERRLLYCVPIPGQNSWTEFPSGVVIIQPTQREKRQRMDDDAVDHMDVLVSGDGCQSSPSNKKMREDGHPSHSESMIEDSCSIASMVPNVEKDLLPCLVKIYDSPESDLKLNDVFEFVGVFTFDKEFTTDKDDGEELPNDFPEDEFNHLPPNKVPRLHCLIHRKLEAHDFLHSSPVVEPKPDFVKEIRESLLRYLTTVLGNDGVAAHFMLLHLLSRVHARVDTFAVGKLTLNLTGFNRESVSIFGNRLNLAVRDLLPYTHSIPVTVEYLNTAALAPKKDYQTNRLMPGVLQIAEGSNLIIDETRLETGTLNSTGIENVRLLKTVMEQQKVEYDFTYYKMDMATDVQVTVLSEGKSNILPADIVVPFRPCSVDSTEVLTAETPEAWRWYLATLRSLPHSIDSEMQKVLENDLVAARQADRSLGSQDFSRWLTMGRLMSLSFGESCLSMEHWQMVKELERLRLERLK